MTSGPSSASEIASATTASAPRSSISRMKCQRMPWSFIQRNTSTGGQYPRSPTWTKFRPLTAPDSMSRRIGVPWPASWPQSSGAVSAWASKCTMPTLPGPRISAIAVADGQVIEWSPPRTIGIAPVSATSRTLR
jgi:hypothetical protein